MLKSGRVLAILVSVAVAALGLSASALAKEKPPVEFEASATGKTKDVALNTQIFKFKPYTVKCKEASSTGTVEETKFTTLADKVTFKGCTYGHKAEAKVSPIEFEFSSEEGAFTIVNEPTITLVQSKCTITIEEGQTVGEEHRAVSYATKGEMPARELEIKTKVHLIEHGTEGGISYTFGKVCEKFEESSGENGVYEGNLLDELVKGELFVT